MRLCRHWVMFLSVWCFSVSSFAADPMAYQGSLSFAQKYVCSDATSGGNAHCQDATDASLANFSNDDASNILPVGNSTALSGDPQDYLSGLFFSLNNDIRLKPNKMGSVQAASLAYNVLSDIAQEYTPASGQSSSHMQKIQQSVAATMQPSWLSSLSGASAKSLLQTIAVELAKNNYLRYQNFRGQQKQNALLAVQLMNSIARNKLIQQEGHVMTQNHHLLQKLTQALTKGGAHGTHM